MTGAESMQRTVCVLAFGTYTLVGGHRRRWVLLHTCTWLRELQASESANNSRGAAQIRAPAVFCSCCNHVALLVRWATAVSGISVQTPKLHAFPSLFQSIYRGSALLPWPGLGPCAMSRLSPRSFHAGSFLSWVAFVMPNAACWSGTTSSSSSGLMGCRCGGTYTSSSGRRSLQKSSKRSASRARWRWMWVWEASLFWELELADAGGTWENRAHHDCSLGTEVFGSECACAGYVVSLVARWSWCQWMPVTEHWLSRAAGLHQRPRR